MPADSSRLGVQLHDLLLKFQKEQRFVARDLAGNGERVHEQIGMTEQSILFVIDAEPLKSVKELSELLTLERSWVSRVVAGLEEKRLVTSRVPANDRRSKQVRIAPKGRSLLQACEVFWQRVMEHCLTPLTVEEQQALHQALRELAGALGAHDFRRHAGRHPVGYELGRISAASGALGRNVLGSALNMNQLQVLYAIRELGHTGIQLSDVNRLVPFDMSTVSRILQAFEENGLVKKSRSERDKRSSSIEVTSAGNRLIEEYRAMAADVFEPVTAKLSKSELRQLCTLLEKLVSALKASRSRSWPEQLTVKPLAGDEELPSSFSSRGSDDGRYESKQLGLYRNNQLAGVVELERTRQGGLLRMLRFSGEELPPEKLVAVLKSSFQSL